MKTDQTSSGFPHPADSDAPSQENDSFAIDGEPGDENLKWGFGPVLRDLFGGRWKPIAAAGGGVVLVVVLSVGVWSFSNIRGDINDINNRIEALDTPTEQTNDTSSRSLSLGDATPRGVSTLQQALAAQAAARAEADAAVEIAAAHAEAITEAWACVRAELYLTERADQVPTGIWPTTNDADSSMVDALETHLLCALQEARGGPQADLIAGLRIDSTTTQGG